MRGVIEDIWIEPFSKSIKFLGTQCSFFGRYCVNLGVNLSGNVSGEL